MTVKEKLMQELECTIDSVLGDYAEEEYEYTKITNSDIDEIARKLKWYLNL